MSEPSNGAWPFQEIPEEEGLDISAIFGDSSAAPQGDPFAPPAAVQSVQQPPAPVMQEITPSVTATSHSATAPIVNTPAKVLAEAPAENPIAAAFEQKTAENTKKGLLEKPPVFYHKGVKEEIDDPSMTFEELRIRKSDDFTDLEEGKRVSWSVEYCGIRKEVKDPKGTTIISMKEMIERSREFLDALKKTKDKAPCCYVKPKVEMKTKGNAAYKGKFGTLEEARTSDKVICLIPSNDGRIYELRKMEQGEFIAPKKNVVDFSEVRAGFSPALPKIPAELMGQIIAFFRAFMTDHGENEAFAQIYWDKAEKRFFAYVPKQSVCKEEVEADLHDCPYDVVKSTGEVKDTFKFQYGGRRYDRLSLSEKIRAGMEVSELMKRLTGRNYPVFVDNMESVDDLANVRPTGQIIMAKCVSGAALQVKPVRPIAFAEQRAA